MEYFLGPIKQYANFTGRARRKEYWMYSLFYAIFYVALLVIESVIGLGGLLTLIYSLALLLPTLAVGARRLHDTNRSGWWLLIALIPLVGSIILLVFFCQDSEATANQFGANPKTGTIEMA